MFEQHLEIFHRLLAANLNAIFDKCHFCRSELKYIIGHAVNKFGLREDACTVEAILGAAPPTNVLEVRRFIGIA